MFILLGAKSKYLLSNFRKHKSDFLLLCVMKYCETNTNLSGNSSKNPHQYHTVESTFATSISDASGGSKGELGAQPSLISP